jgi:ADP-ribosylglycohydrolase
MFGAICGDVVASIYESPMFGVESLDFPLFVGAARFTDDTVLTVALADAILSNTPYEEKIKEWHDKYPNSGYGSRFVEWAENFGPNNKIVNDSYSNGAMMRVSPIGYAFDTLDQVDKEAERSVAFTHNNDEARRGAKAIANAVFLARKGRTKQYIQRFIEEKFGYDLNYRVQHVRDHFDKRTIRCDVTGPQALIVFLESTGFENTIRNAIYSRGDCDTISAIACSIAYPFYGTIPDDIKQFTFSKLPRDMALVISKFHEKFD